MKKNIVIITTESEILCGLAKSMAHKNCDDNVKISQMNFSTLNNTNNDSLNEYDGIIVTNLDWQQYLASKNSPGHFIIKKLKEKKYKGKLIVSVDATKIEDECIHSINWTNDVLFVHSLYWREMDKIKKFILT